MDGLLFLSVCSSDSWVIGFTRSHCSLSVSLSDSRWASGSAVSSDNERLGIILGIIVGIALGIATHFLIRFSLFLAGMAGGAVIASMLLPYTSLTLDSTGTLIAYLASALAGGLLTLLLYKILILFVTSLVGTYMIWLGTAQVFPSGSEKMVMDSLRCPSGCVHTRSGRRPKGPRRSY